MLSRRNFLFLIPLSFIAVLVVGFKPFVDTVDPSETLLEQADTYLEEVERLSDGTYLVSARTPMPQVNANMVRWWFADFLKTTQHYSWWHPKDHLWMDWENKVPGEIVGASHLVHEYVGGELLKLRIQFVNSKELFGYDANNDDTFVLCAKVGLLEENINIAKMCHVVRNTKDGAEMRSRFWLGHVSKRDGNRNISSFQGFIGNTTLVRLFVLNKKNSKDLQRHAQEEMKYLAELLPALYESETGIKPR